MIMMRVYQFICDVYLGALENDLPFTDRVPRKNSRAAGQGSWQPTPSIQSLFQRPRAVELVTLVLTQMLLERLLLATPTCNIGRGDRTASYRNDVLARNQSTV